MMLRKDWMGSLLGAWLTVETVMFVLGSMVLVKFLSLNAFFIGMATMVVLMVLEVAVVVITGYLRKGGK